MHEAVIGDYRLIASLGRGGMAEVFLAVKRGLASFTKLVVIKRLRSDLAELPEAPKFRELLLDEARLAARLHHPSIVQTFEVNEHEGNPFMAMEYLDGQPLNNVIVAVRSAKAKIPVEIIARIVSDMLSALEYAHDLADYDGKPLRIVHRDVSPQNVFWTYDGEIKLVDFGVAKSAESAQTEAGVVKGRIAYMAPEQALGETIDRRADVFSAGVVLWELVTGQRLLRGDSVAASLHRLLYEPIPPLDTMQPGIDPAIAQVCAHALERDVAKRYPTAAAMREELDKAVARMPRREELAKFIQPFFEEQRREVKARIREALATEAKDDQTLITIVPAPLSSGNVQDPISSLSAALRTPGLVRTAGVAPPSRGARWKVGVVVAALASAAAGAFFVLRMEHGDKKATPAPVADASAAVTKATEPALYLCGSNTIGAELGPALVEAFLKKKGAATVTRTPGPLPQETILSAKVSGADLDVDLRASGTATAFDGLAARTCDVGMASRAINEQEVSLLEKADAGDMSSPATEHVVALDGIAVLVNPNNGVHALDRAALHDVFTGHVADWSGAGGAPGPIAVLALDQKSGTFDTFKHLVLGSDDVASTTKRFVEADALSDAVASDPSAIGFGGLTSVRSAKAVAVGDHGTPPMLPSSFTVTTEEYLLSRRLYLYVHPKPRTPLAVELVSFATSPQGQAVVRGAGFIDLGVTLQDAPCDTRCVPRYAALVANAQRLSVDFRFRPTGALDSRATRDIDRLVQFLRAYPSGKLILIGFSDPTGDGAANVKLSRDRAQLVASELQMRGIRPGTVEGLGSAMPVAPSTAESDRARNRRVEVWLQR